MEKIFELEEKEKQYYKEEESEKKTSGKEATESTQMSEVKVIFINFSQTKVFFKETILNETQDKNKLNVILLFF